MPARSNEEPIVRLILGGTVVRLHVDVERQPAAPMSTTRGTRCAPARHVCAAGLRSTAIAAN
jgi:hypothetical protein